MFGGPRRAFKRWRWSVPTLSALPLCTVIFSAVLSVSSATCAMEGSPSDDSAAQAMRDRIEARNSASRKRASQARLYTSTPPTPSPASTPLLAPSHSISKWNRSPADVADVLDASTLAKLFISVASATDVGKRSYMEDRVTAVTFDHPTTLEPLAFVAVFDGHGGTQCADFLQNGLHPSVKNHLAALRRSFHDAPFESLETVFRLACRDADKGFLSSHLADDSGSCAVFALVGKDKWVVGNVGDSQVVLSRHGRAIDLCVAHTPQHPDERARILAANGQIVQDRYIFGYLGVSRSFGDRFVKVERPVVIATPDVVSGGRRHSHPGDEFLLLACDGLFEVFTPQEAVDFVTHHKTVNQMTPQAICDLLVHTAIENGSQDNVSVVLVMLNALP